MDDEDEQRRIRELLSTVRHAREVLTQHAERLDRLGLPDARLIRTVVRALAKAGDRFLTDTQPLADLPVAPKVAEFAPPPTPQRSTEPDADDASES